MSEASKILDQCRGMSAAQVSKQLGNVDIDKVTKLLVAEFGERTTVPRIPKLPFLMRHTMYGDDDVADWVLEYTESGYEVIETSDATEADGHLRWEHWEDAIRVLNGDGQLLSLVNTGRVALVDTTPAVIRSWFGAVRLPGDDERQRASAIQLEARDAAVVDDESAMDYVSQKGLDVVLPAVVYGLVSMIHDSGVAEGLAGHTLRWEVLAPQNPTAVEAAFSADASPVVRVVPFSDPPADGCLIFRWKSYEGWLRNIGDRNNMAKAVAAGELGFDGQQALLEHVMRAVRALAPPAGNS